MKWGVRRSSRGSSGSSSGKAVPPGFKKIEKNTPVRVSDDNGTRTASTARTGYHSPHAKKISMAEMDDAQLAGMIKRLEMEKRFKDLTAQDKSIGRKIVDAALKDVIGAGLKNAGRNAVEKGVSAGVRKYTGFDISKGDKKSDKKSDESS